MERSVHVKTPEMYQAETMSDTRRKFCNAAKDWRQLLLFISEIRFIQAHLKCCNHHQKRPSLFRFFTEFPEGGYSCPSHAHDHYRPPPATPHVPSARNLEHTHGQRSDPSTITRSFLSPNNGGSFQKVAMDSTEGQHGSVRRDQQRECLPYHAEGRTTLKDEEFEAKEAELRATSAARWAENELFSLDNAFGLQLQRLEVV